MFFRVLLISFFVFAIGFKGSSQTILYQDFEGGADDWNYTLTPSSYSASGDIWATRATLSSITPSSGTQFWGMQDLENSNGGGNFEHKITFNTVDVSSHTGVTITFDYHTIGFDSPSDYIRYEVFENGTGQGAVNLNNNTGAMTSISYSVPDAVNSVYIVLIAKQNGSSDYAGWDNIKISGTSSGGPTPHTVTFNGNGNDGGSMSNQTASSSTALTTNTFTQTGCTFVEWNTAANGSGTSYADGANYNFSSDITLYAQWNCGGGGGNCIDEDFVDFSDWTNSGTAIDNVASHYGAAAPCRAIGSSDELISPSVDNPTQLQFYQDASGGGNGNTALIEYSLDNGSTWITCYTFTVTESGNTETVDLTNISGVDLSAFTGVIFQFSSSFNTWYLDDVVVSCGSAVTNTITTGVVSGSPFSVECNIDDNGTVSFTSTDTFGGGNIYTAQLSNASGSFASATNIGTLSSTANTGTITITIPSGTPNGSGYKIRVVSSNPYVVGSESSAFTINLTNGPCAPPHITSVMFNGCDPSGCGGEGRSEIVFANTGANSVLVNSANFELIYPGSPAYDMLGTVVSNTSTITTMNDSANCGTLFYNANGQTVPPNTTMLLLSSSVCAEINFDWSSFCGQGPIYVVFGQSGNQPGDEWYDNGNFGNGSGNKSFDLAITATDGNTYSYNYTYNSSNQGDGEYANFSSTSPGGNAISTGVLDDCKVSPVVLPIQLLHFKGKTINESNLLEWTTTSEINNDYFTIEKSTDAVNFSNIGTVSGAGNSNINIDYSFVDDNLTNSTNYYRLKQTDFDGKFSYSNTIVLSNDLSNNVFYNNTSKQLEIGDIKNGTVNIYNLQGQVVKSITANNSTVSINLSKGMYLIAVQTETEVFSKKIVVN